MSAIVLDIAQVNSTVIPNLERTTSKLQQARDVCNQLINQLPNTFSYKNRLQNLATKINDYRANLKDVTLKINLKAEEARTIEEKNGSILSSVIQNISLVSSTLDADISAATGAKNVSQTTGTQTEDTSFKGWLKNTCSNIASSVSSFFSDVWAESKNVGQKILEGSKKTAKDVKSFFTDKVSPTLMSWFKQAMDNKVINFFVRTAASINNLSISLLEGIVSFVEALGDAVLIVSSIASPHAMFINGVTFYYDLATGIFTGDWSFNATGTVWKKGILPLVGRDFTGEIFDKVEQINLYDKFAWDWAKRKGGEGTACKISKGVGYVAGIIILTITTYGIGTGITGATSGASGVSSFLTSKMGSLISTLFSGFGKFGQSTQEGYNSLSEEGKNSNKEITKVLFSSLLKGGIEAGTWYLTYGKGATYAAKSSNKVISKVGNLLSNKTQLLNLNPKSVPLKKFVENFVSNITKATIAKAGLQGIKEYANEGASVIVDGDYDFKKANINAFSSATTSFIYDTTISAWMGKGITKLDGESGSKTTPEQALSEASEVADDGITAGASEVSETFMDKIKNAAKTVTRDILDYSKNDAGGKKIVGGGIKSIIKTIEKEVIKHIIE